MDTVDGLRAFVATAETGSFTGAAGQLGISNRLTSKYVGELEERLGVRLFQRTTRRVGLTPAGETLLARIPTILEDLDEALAAMSEEARGLSGVIRVSAPVTLGETYVACMLGRFADAHPGVTIDLRLNDAYVDLASEGIDLAMRVGLGDALAVKARMLGEMRSGLVASPDYLSEHGNPETIEALADHALILDSNMRNPRRWTLTRKGQSTTLEAAGNFIVNSARAAADLAAADRGIAFAPTFASGDHLAAGRLVPVLPEYSGSSNRVSAVYLEGRKLPTRVRALIEFAVGDWKSWWETKESPVTIGD